MVDRTIVVAKAKTGDLLNQPRSWLEALLVRACSSVGDRADRQTVGERGAVVRPKIPVDVRFAGNEPAATSGKVSRKAAESGADANPSRREFL